VTAARRSERRRPPAQQLLRRPKAAAFLSGARKGLPRGLDELRRLSGIETAWWRLLRRLSPEREEFRALSQLALTAHEDELRAGNYEAYAEAVRRDGQGLARQGVPEEHATAAPILHLERCLARLLGPKVEKRETVLALVRLTAAFQSFTLAGYGDGRSEGWRRLDEQERLKLSRDLHDEVGADLVVLKLYIEMMRMELGRGHIEQVGAKLEEALSLVSRTIDSVRRLTLDLGPAILEQIGFVPAVRLYARQFGSRTGIKIEVRVAEVPGEIPAGHERALYRVMQGALSNVAKHAKAQSVRISLGSLRDTILVMIIEDDGVGFDAVQLPPGFGLTAMRDRLQSLGGRLHVESRTPRGLGGRCGGTRIEIDLPLQAGGGG
jgi:signal transduction histidine kinase